MECKEYQQEDLDKVHRVEMEILDEFARICKKYKLTYFLTGGTMLGTVRHKGFIPWDDDIDIGMMRKDYDLFIKYAKDELNEKYNLRGKINNIICMYMLKIIGCDEPEINEFKKLINKTYGSKGEQVVNNNINAIDEAINYLEEIDNKIFTLEESPQKRKDFTDEVLKLRGNMLKVSDFINCKDGTFKGGTAKSDKRKISESVPKWCKENCIQ